MDTIEAAVLLAASHHATLVPLSLIFRHRREEYALEVSRHDD